MAYNNPSPHQSTTLTAAERAKEARRILTMLREEPTDDLEQKLTAKAMGFVEGKWLEMDFGGKLENIHAGSVPLVTGHLGKIRLRENQRCSTTLK
jgi:hypothetical protein